MHVSGRSVSEVSRIDGVAGEISFSLPIPLVEDNAIHIVSSEKEETVGVFQTFHLTEVGLLHFFPLSFTFLLLLQNFNELRYLRPSQLHGSYTLQNEKGN